MSDLEAFSDCLTLQAVLDRLRLHHGGYDLLEHWSQGEFHHDVVVRVADRSELPGAVMLVATNCNGGVKEVLCFSKVPERWALWNRRCPSNDEFEGEVAQVLAELRTQHWFDPCELLKPDARSEYLPQHRRRARGGGWEPAT